MLQLQVGLSAPPSSLSLSSGKSDRLSPAAGLLPSIRATRQPTTGRPLANGAGRRLDPPLMSHRVSSIPRGTCRSPPHGRRTLKSDALSDATAAAPEADSAPPSADVATEAAEGDSSKGSSKQGERGEEAPSVGAADAGTMKELSAYLERELPRLFSPQGMQIQGKFEEVVEFEDPITRYSSLNGYLFNIAMLRLLFSPSFLLHSVYQSGPAELTTRWTMKMYFKLLPWQPELVFTGISIYGINPASKKFISHKDIWDSVQDNAYFSREGLVDLLSQCSQVYGSASSNRSPAFDVLLRKSGYEVRMYKAYDVLQLAAPGNATSVGTLQPGTDPLQRFLESSAVLSGCTLGVPYMWEVGKEAGAGQQRQVQIRRPLFFKSSAPAAADGVQHVAPQAVAVSAFAGTPTLEDYEAAAAFLRSCLLKDGLTPDAPPGGFVAARYHAPSLVPVPPPLLRNEVMLPLRGFQWP